MEAPLSSKAHALNAFIWVKWTSAFSSLGHPTNQMFYFCRLVSAIQFFCSIHYSVQLGLLNSTLACVSIAKNIHVTTLLYSWRRSPGAGWAGTTNTFGCLSSVGNTLRPLVPVSRTTILIVSRQLHSVGKKLVRNLLCARFYCCRYWCLGIPPRA